MTEVVHDLRAYFSFYDDERLHEVLEYQTPAQVAIKH